MTARYKIQKYRCCLVRDGQVSLPAPEGRLMGASDAARVFVAMARRADREHMWVAYLDGANHVTGVEEIARGGQGSLGVLPTDVLRGALVHGARAIVIGHNHPSGDPEPSIADVAMTRELAAAAQVVGLDLLDHVIVTREERYVSLGERGLLR